jgi:hypothetical protein
MKKILTLFMFLTSLSFSQSLGGRHIIIAYDISGSMQTVGMSDPGRINGINNFLLSRLLDSKLDPGSAKVVQSPGTILTQPLLREGDKITFGLIGQTFDIKMEQSSSVSQIKLADFLPKNTQTFNAPKTELNSVFSYFLDQIERSIDPVLILISDELQSGPVPVDAELKVLNGFNHYHIGTVETYQFFQKNANGQGLYFKIYKVNSSKAEVLRVSGSSSDTLLLTISKDSVLRFKNRYTIETEKNVPSKSVSDILLSVQFFDSAKNKTLDTILSFGGLPINLDTLNPLLSSNIPHSYMTLETRYRYEDQPRWQELLRAKTISLDSSVAVAPAESKGQQKKSSVLLWIFIPLLIIGIGVVVYFVIKKLKAPKPESFRIQNMNNGQVLNFEILIGEELGFSAKSFGTKNVKVFNINCPEFMIRYSGNQIFELMENGIFKSNVSCSKDFTITNNISNQVTLRITR